MIIGAHTIIFSTEPEADRAFMRDILLLPNVDAGDGWLIFGLPPAELGIHPNKHNNVHRLYLMCADIERLIAEMKQLGVVCDAVSEAEWGLLTNITLPGGGKLGIYQPNHPRPNNKV